MAKKNKVYLIEDCSQAHGAEFNKKKVGTFGDLSCFSFYPTKNLSTFGDAGIVCTNNKKMLKKIKFFREYGWKKKNIGVSEGYNKRLDELHAGILNVKLDNIDKFNKKRILIANKFLNLIKSKKILLPQKNNSKKHVFHLFVIRVKNNLRSKFISYLKKMEYFLEFITQYQIINKYHLENIIEISSQLQKKFQKKLYQFQITRC